MTFERWKYPLQFLGWVVLFLISRAQYDYAHETIWFLSMCLAGLNALLTLIVAYREGRKGRA